MHRRSASSPVVMVFICLYLVVALLLFLAMAGCATTPCDPSLKFCELERYASAPDAEGIMTLQIHTSCLEGSEVRVSVLDGDYYWEIERFQVEFDGLQEVRVPVDVELGMGTCDSTQIVAGVPEADDRAAWDAWWCPWTVILPWAEPEPDRPDGVVAPAR